MFLAKGDLGASTYRKEDWNIYFVLLKPSPRPGSKTALVIGAYVLPAKKPELLAQSGLLIQRDV